jgi:excinuclease UvrABC nuclease subunit
MTFAAASLFDAAAQVVWPLSDEQLAAVPAKRGVFCLLADDDRPIVLLTGADIRARLRARLAQREPAERKKTADLREITRTILWKLATSHFETDLLYLELARTIWPAEYTGMLAWRAPWFVHVDPRDKYPHLDAAREVLGRQGRYIGPFADGKSAQRFVETVQDAFGLCRHLRCLRLAPNAPPCAYAQMGKCVSICDGTMSLDDYRALVARAADFAAGDRQRTIAELTAEMKAAAAELRFERAAALKTLLGRLGELDKPAYEHVRPVERFRFILVQQGESSRAAKVFLAAGGTIASGPPLPYPPDQQHCAAALAAMADLDRHVASAPLPSGDELTVARQRMGLVAGYLFSGELKRGLMLPWEPTTAPGDLAAATHSAAKLLHLKAHTPKAAKGAKGAAHPDAPPDQAPAVPDGLEHPPRQG